MKKKKDCWCPGCCLLRRSVWRVFGKNLRLGDCAQCRGEENGAPVITVGQNLSFTSDTGTDILSRHALPGFERMEKNDQDKYVNNLQVIKKAQLLGMGERDFLYPEIKMSYIEKDISVLGEWYGVDRVCVDFWGTTSGELQQVINDNPDAIIDINVARIWLDDTIILHDNTVIKGNGAEFASDGLQYGFMGENVSGIYIDNIRINGNMDYGLYFISCSDVMVSDSEINRCLQKAICIVGGGILRFKIKNNEMRDNGAGALYIAGDVSKGLIEGNVIENSRGTSNWMAGMVLTSDNPQNKKDIWDSFDDSHRCPYRENLYRQTNAPHEIIVRNNVVCHGNSSGIYSDGVYSCYVIGNRIKYNDKEGICLDNGTLGFYLKENTFERNGQRGRQTDDDLKFDFVLGTGRMEDGSAKSKLPGVSLDNTAYNILENNIVINNYGGGIKMVRTTVRSLIMENIVRDNNMGQNDIFHFFGIELGAASAGAESTDMDFAPDFENIVCRNSITGNHYSGVFIGEDCYVNDIFDNVIMEPRMFAVEAISRKFNSIVNNISNAGIRNEYIEKRGG